jgi:hypothetical protein
MRPRARGGWESAVAHLKSRITGRPSANPTKKRATITERAKPYRAAEAAGAGNEASFACRSRLETTTDAVAALEGAAE